MSAGHTPGPWVIEPGHSVVFIRTADGSNIATTNCCHYWQEFTEQALANARLIAAAPEMLEALEEAVGCLSEYENEMLAPGVRILDGARAAIAKARGQ